MRPKLVSLLSADQMEVLQTEVELKWLEHWPERYLRKLRLPKVIYKDAVGKNITSLD